MRWMGRDWRADQAFLVPRVWGGEALHGVRPRRARSRLPTFERVGGTEHGALVNGSVSGINGRSVGRSVHVDAWIVCVW